MATVTSKPAKVPELMLEGYSITPDAFAGKTPAEIVGLPAHEGKVHVTLGDFFEVSGASGETAADTDIVIAGDCTRVKYIGSKMTAGSVTVNGNADMYVGGWMKGGKIHIQGKHGLLLRDPDGRWRAPLRWQCGQPCRLRLPRRLERYEGWHHPDQG